MDESIHDEILKKKEELSTLLVSELEKEVPDYEKIDGLRLELEKCDLQFYVKYSDQLVKTELMDELNRFHFLLQTRKKMSESDILKEIKFNDDSQMSIFFEHIRKLPNVRVRRSSIWPFGEDIFELSKI